MNLPDGEHTLLEDVPELAARRGDVIAVRSSDPEAATVLWRRLSEDETLTLLTGQRLMTDFITEEELKALDRHGLQLVRPNRRKARAT